MYKDNIAFKLPEMNTKAVRLSFITIHIVTDEACLHCVLESGETESVDGNML
jgi:hypothetical protein